MTLKDNGNLYSSEIFTLKALEFINRSNTRIITHNRMYQLMGLLHLRRGETQLFLKELVEKDLLKHHHKHGFSLTRAAFEMLKKGGIKNGRIR
jgi:DNA-binding IclR family transcriptional regulator